MFTTSALESDDSASAYTNAYGPFFDTYECCAEEQTIAHVVLQCPIHRSPLGLHSLMVLDDETIEWLLNTCPEIPSSFWQNTQHRKQHALFLSKKRKYQ